MQYSVSPIRNLLFIAAAAAFLFTGCKTTQTEQISYPPGEEIYVTSGDGNFGDYSPVGQLYFSVQGNRIPLPILGCFPVADVQPSQAIRQEVKKRARKMGGDAVINLKLTWNPPQNNFLPTLCTLATGGHLTVYGNVIKR